MATPKRLTILQRRALAIRQQDRRRARALGPRDPFTAHRIVDEQGTRIVDEQGNRIVYFE